MPRGSKSQPDRDPFDFDLNLDLDLDTDDDKDAVLTPVFQGYYTPPDPYDKEFSEDETFIEAVHEENANLKNDLIKADEQASLLHQTKKVVDSGTDSDYYLVIAFVSEEQKQEFVKNVGWEQFGGTRFLNGVLLAQHLGISLQPGYLAVSSNPDKQLAERSLGHGSIKKEGRKKDRS